MAPRRWTLREWRWTLRKWTLGIVSKDSKSTFLQPQKHDALSFIPSAVLIIMEFIIIMHFIRWVAQLSQLLKRPLELIPGDHIYTWRAFCTYSHHGKVPHIHTQYNYRFMELRQILLEKKVFVFG